MVFLDKMGNVGVCLRPVFKERVIIASVAVFLGVLLAAGGFYLWQSTKIITSPKTGLKTETPKPASSPSPMLTIEAPNDEQVLDKRIVQVSGKVANSTSVIVSMNTQDIAIKTATDGSFATNVTLSEGVNYIEILAILEDGSIVSQTRTVTFTTETF